MNPFTSEALRANLTTAILGLSIEIYKQVGSTNDLVREAARHGESEGLVIAADEQIAGRGRLGRAWRAPSGCCVLCSVLLRPRFSPQHAFYLTIAAALAIYRSIKSLSPRSSVLSTPTIKWPNDVLLGGRKVSGVLCESEFAGRDWVFSVVGFGINVNLSTDELGDLRDSATALSITWGEKVDRTLLLAHTLNELESLYFTLQEGQFGAVYEEWAAALETVGKHITVKAAEESLTGYALRVDPDGALVIRLEGGGEKRVLAGDVTMAGD
jgi:BirA family biotin operon repressor/biotin-[acetyl-CoA-carboxylase] ligase